MPKKKSLLKKHKNKLLLALATTPQVTFAASNNKLVAVFDNLITFLTSTLARGAGITAIAAVGYLYLFQNKIDKGRAIAIVVAIGLILGASSIYDMVAG